MDLQTVTLPVPSQSLTVRIISLYEHAIARSVLAHCEHESAESTYGAGDAIPCGAIGVVTDLATEQTVCLRHFSKGGR